MSKDKKKLGALIFWLIMLVGCILIVFFGMSSGADTMYQDDSSAIEMKENTKERGDASYGSEPVRDKSEMIPSGVISEDSEE